MFIISIKRIRGMSLIWLCVVVALQGCASAPKGNWQFTEYSPQVVKSDYCGKQFADAKCTFRTDYYELKSTGHVLRLEQVKE